MPRDPRWIRFDLGLRLQPSSFSARALNCADPIGPRGRELVWRSPALGPGVQLAGSASGRVLAFVALVLITAIASARLIGLDQLLLWHDEVYTLMRVFGHSAEEGWRLLFSDRVLTADQLLTLQRPELGLGLADTWRELTGHPEHAPLYYLLGRLAAQLPLEPVIALRGTSALFGLLLPAAAFWLMRELFGRGPVPWIAALIVACSPLHLLYAQEARQYALWTLLVLASSAALVRVLRLSAASSVASDSRLPAARASRRDAAPRSAFGPWALYGLLLTLGLYTHLLFALMLPVHAVYGWLDSAHRSGRVLRSADLPWRPWLIAAGSALVLFLPWVVVLLLGLERTLDVTSWMAKPVGVAENLRAWGDLLVRGTLDLWPDALPDRALLLLLPMVAALIYYSVKAPLPQRWLLLLIALASVTVVLGPDLLFGGKRSLHARYGLPALLAVQLMMAWTLGAVLTGRPAGRLVAGGAVAAIAVLGLVSQQQIRAAETWWHKRPVLSALTPRAVATLNAQPRPFLVVGGSELSLGQALTVAHRLDDRARILAINADTPPTAIPSGLDQAMILIPTEPVIIAFGSGFRLEPWGDGQTWALATAVSAAAPAHPYQTDRSQSPSRSPGR